jgi:hypothetical protein
MSKKGCIIFDDTVADKDYSHEIEGVRRQYSGNAHGIVKGIGIVTFVYFNPELDGPVQNSVFLVTRRASRTAFFLHTNIKI